jgi:hypothetical protein
VANAAPSERVQAVNVVAVVANLEGREAVEGIRTGGGHRAGVLSKQLAEQIYNSRTPQTVHGNALGAE